MSRMNNSIIPVRCMVIGWFIGLHFCSLNDFLWFGEAPRNLIGAFREVINTRRRWRWKKSQMRLSTSQPSALQTWWRSTSKHPGLQNVKLSALFCRFLLLSAGCIFLGIWLYSPCTKNFCENYVWCRNCWRRLDFWASSNVSNLRLKSWQRCFYHAHYFTYVTLVSCQVSLKHEIVAVPTVILFRAGKAVDRYVVGTKSTKDRGWAHSFLIINITQGGRCECSWTAHFCLMINVTQGG